MIKVRSERKDFWTDAVKVILAAPAFLFIISTFDLAARWYVKAFEYELQSIYMPDHTVGEDPKIEAYRDIKSATEQSWTVTLRTADDHQFVCSEGSPYTITYEPKAGQRNPIHSRLSSWMWDEDSLNRCEKRGFGPGRFYANTCHTRRLLKFYPVRICKPSNIFERKAK